MSMAGVFYGTGLYNNKARYYLPDANILWG